MSGSIEDLADMDLEELWCAGCGTVVGYMVYAGPHGSVYCGPCGQKQKDEAERPVDDDIDPGSAIGMSGNQ